MPVTNSPTMMLSISGQDPSQRLQKTLQEEVVTRIGRSPQSGWAIPWDQAISREHADVCWAGGQLRVICLPGARNPLVYRGKPTRELAIVAGDWFKIGDTTFQAGGVDKETASKEDTVSILDAAEPESIEEHAYSEEDLSRVAFRNTEQQMELLCKLPRMISGSHSDEELGQTLCKLLVEAIPQADAVAVAHFDETELPEDESQIDDFPEPLTMRVETRDGYEGRFNPSRRMLLKTLRRQANVLHIWGGDEDSGAFTVSEGLGWAFCVPVRGESCQGWCLYVSGQGTANGGLLVTENDLTGDLRFTELVAQFIGSVRQVRILQEQKTQLSSFFSPKVIENLTAHSAGEMLSPAEKEISVLFCDVRGFSKKSEELQGDLHALLRSVSAALGVMAGGILERDGAIADFQGDAALGFWGWPLELEDGPVPACRAALSIYTKFCEAIDAADGLLEGFSVGIGIAHGRALAGQIGTDQQSKMGVFGPVVNQGARLEGMTKQLNVPICIDAATADFAQRFLPPTDARVRRLARVRPKGMDTAMDVFGLLPPVDRLPSLTSQMIADHEASVEAIVDGKWDEAAQLLSTLPPEDGPKQFLVQQMARFKNVPPEGWDGAFSLTSK